MKTALSVQDISKRFGQVQALKNVSLDFNFGQIHAILGENGAGKSTLMNVLNGAYRPDSGSLQFFGSRIGMVHQHFMLVPEFTVAENLQLSATNLDRNAVDQCIQLAHSLGWQLQPEDRVQNLSVGVRQRIEIVKALAIDPDVLILDEPTAVLAQHEVEDLFGVLRGLASDGKSVLIIAHKLSEVLSIADHVSVLRRGELVGSVPAAETDSHQLVLWMVGPGTHRIDQVTGTIGDPVLTAKNLTVISNRGNVAVNGVSFTIRKGEILGFGGVDGNGQVELAEALAGVRNLAGGEIDFRASRDQIAYIPQDRHKDGLALTMSVMENLQFSAAATPNSVVIALGQRRKIAAQRVTEFDVRTPSIDSRVGTLSGGNQQKVVVARALEINPILVVAVNPTRGLDVRAAASVQARIREAAEHGAAVALFSTDSDELQVLAHRKVFLNSGRLFDSESDALIGAQI